MRKQKGNDNVEVTVSSGNVFADLGFENPREELAKAELAAKIIAIIQERELTQKKAADILGIDQPKVSALSRGRFGGFSIERLFSFLMALDRDIEVIIKQRPHSRRTSEIHVYAAQ